MKFYFSNNNILTISFLIMLSFSLYSNVLGTNQVIISEADEFDTSWFDYPEDIPTEFTPFNVTTTLHWNEKSFYEPSRGMYWDKLVLMDVINDTIQSKNADEIPFYATLLPLYPNDSHISFSLDVLDYSGPSNVSITIKTMFFHRHGGNYHLPETSFSFDTNKTLQYSGEFLSSELTNFSQSKINNTNFYPLSYADLVLTPGNEIAYTLFSIIPDVTKFDTYWNHSLSLQVSVAGSEDRPFFNYVRSNNNAIEWADEQFQALIMEKTTSLDQKNIFFGPMHRVDYHDYDQNIYINTTMDPEPEDFVTVTLQITSSADLKYGLSINRYSMQEGNGGRGSGKFIKTPYFQSGSNITIQFNWNDIERANIPLELLAPCCIPSEEIIKNISTIEIFPFSNFNGWRDWVNITASVEFRPHNIAIPSNHIIFHIESPDGSKKDLSMDASIGSFPEDPDTLITPETIILVGSLFLILLGVIVYTRKK